LPNSVNEPGALSDNQLQQLQAGGPSNVGSNLFSPFQSTDPGGNPSTGGDFFGVIENFLARFGIITLGVALLIVAVWAGLRGELQGAAKSSSQTGLKGLERAVTAGAA
jgi:hypothetical protein